MLVERFQLSSESIVGLDIYIGQGAFPMFHFTGFSYQTTF